MGINVIVTGLLCIDYDFPFQQLTVRQFKERIKEKTGIEPDLQRLIYCGRVMNDEHPLSDYGKRTFSVFVCIAVDDLRFEKFRRHKKSRYF